MIDIKTLQPGDIIINRDRFFLLGAFPVKMANYLKKGYDARGWVHFAYGWIETLH